MTRLIKLQDKGDRLLRATHGLRQKGWGCSWLSPLWVWMPPLLAFEALHLAETPPLVSGHPGRGRSQPWPSGKSRRTAKGSLGRQDLDFSSPGLRGRDWERPAKLVMERMPGRWRCDSYSGSDPDLHPALLMDWCKQEVRWKRPQVQSRGGQTQKRARAFDEQLTVSRDSIAVTLSPVVQEFSLSVSQNWKH